MSKKANLLFLSCKWRTALVCFFVALAFFGSGTVLSQTETASTIIVTPSSVVLLVGENTTLYANDSSGRPVAEAKWSISTPIAELRMENGEAQIEGKHAGKAILSAKFDGQFASATVYVLDKSLPTSTVHWSLDPLRGYEALTLVEAAPIGDSNVDLYSIEWSKSSNAMVRALRATGQQLWIALLASSASPSTLKHALPDLGGQTTLKGQPLDNVRQILLGDKSAFATTGRVSPNSLGLPLDGKSILLNDTGDGFGGLLLLERGRFRDSIVDLNGADGRELWRYRSTGRLSKEWTVNYEGDVGIVETLTEPPSAALLMLDGKTGDVRFKIPFPNSSTTIYNFTCTPGNTLVNLRPSRAGSVFTSSDGSMYTQVEIHNESQDPPECGKGKGSYSFENSLQLLRVAPQGETEWKTFQQIHADGQGHFVVQPRVFAGESIPDGLGGVLAAWTYFFPGAAGGEKPRYEARLSRIGSAGQQDYRMPMDIWTPGINTLFFENMILGEKNRLYATNGKIVFQFDIPSSQLRWVRQPPSGDVRLQFAAAGGGFVLSNAGRLHYFDAEGNGMDFSCTVPTSNLDDVGLAQYDLFDQTPLPALLLRYVAFHGGGFYYAVEEGEPNGRGTLISFFAR
jgi:outer membrane protein assembly factor BamB